MSKAQNIDRLSVLSEYSQGHIGTRDAIERLELRDYADLLIELAQHDLVQPKPSMTPAHTAHIVQVTAILQPRLQYGN
jgi:hypothetical protein